MLEITELSNRSIENNVQESKLKLHWLKWFNLKGKLMGVCLGLFLLTLTLPLNLSSGINDPNDKWYEMKIPSADQIRKLDNALEKEVSKYIRENSFGSKLKANKFIKECYSQNFDIILALSQAQVESHFGTRGIASRTNSVFNVGTYDNGTILYRYDDPNLSITPYIWLVKNKYMMIDKKSAIDLLKPMCFVNHKGFRYASLKSYEYRVKTVYDHIKSETLIDNLWNEIKREDVKYSREILNSGKIFSKLIKTKS